MASDIFKAMGNQPQKQQNPREAAMEMLKQQGIQIPQGMEDNPQAIIQHLVQSGKIPQGRLGMAQQILSRMFKR